MSVRDGEIVIIPARRVRGGVDLEQLVSEIPADYEPREIDCGPPVGARIW